MESWAGPGNKASFLPLLTTCMCEGMEEESDTQLVREREKRLHVLFVSYLFVHGLHTLAVEDESCPRTTEGFVCCRGYNISIVKGTRYYL